MKYSHIIITAAFCLACLPLSIFYSQAIAAFFFPAWFYIGRELAQAEERYIDAHGGHRKGCPWNCGFFAESWNKKSFLDWILPLAVSTAFFAGMLIYYVL